MHCGVCLYCEHEVNVVIVSCFAIDNDWFTDGGGEPYLVRCARVHELIGRSRVGSVVVDSVLNKFGEIVGDGNHSVTSMDGVDVSPVNVCGPAFAVCVRVKVEVFDEFLFLVKGYVDMFDARMVRECVLHSANSVELLCGEERAGEIDGER